MRAQTVSMGSMKRPLAPVLPATGSEKLISVPQDGYMHQFVSAVNPSNISPMHRTQCTQYMQAHTVCMGSTKRPLAPVLPAIGSDELTNVPRLVWMDICINLYQQLAPQTSVLRTGHNATSICRPILYVWETRNGLSPQYCLQQGVRN